MSTGKIKLSVGYTGGFDEELHERVDAIEDNIDEINLSLDNMEQQLQGGFDEELHERVDVIEGEIDEINSSLDNMEQQLQGGLNIDLSNYQIKTDNSLVTSNKTVVGAINEVFQSVSNGKVLVATAITDKGIDTSSDATFEVMASNISKIQSGGEASQIKTETRTLSGEAITCTHTIGKKTRNTKLTSMSTSGVLGIDGKYHLKYRVENGVQHINQFDTRYSSTDYDFEIPYPLVGNGATNNEIRQKEDGTFEYVKRCTSASETNYCFEVPPLTPDEYNGRNSNYVYNDNKLYMICGSDSPTRTNKCYVYDFISGHWSTIADFPHKAYGVGVCYYQGKIYVLGGYAHESGYIKDILIYDIESNEWSATPLPTDKYDSNCEYATCLIKDDIMYINKYNASSTSSYLYIYDINLGTLTRSVASSKSLTSNTIVENDDKIYCSSSESGSQNTLCIYDIKNNSWEYIVTPENMNIFRSATALVGDKIYYVGGQYPSTNNKFISYDIKTKQFESLNNCNTICRSSYSFYRDNILYVIGGLSKVLNVASNSEFNASCLGWRCYDFEKKYWSDIAPYGTERHANSCSSYGDYVYTTGYSSSSIYKRNLETGEASLISAPNTLDSERNFTTIYGDKMYVSNNGSKYLNIYDLTTNLWLDRIDIPFYGYYNLTMDIHNGIIYMNGYTTESSGSPALFMLDLSTGSSDYILQTYLNRDFLTSIVCGNKIYYFGGGDKNVTYEYDIDTRNFKQLAPIPIPITKACCAEYNGNIYLIGGCTTNKISNKKIYVYNIANDTWSESIDLPSVVNGTCIVKGEYLYIFAGSCDTSSYVKTYVTSNIYKLKIGDLQTVEEEIIPLEQDFNMTTKKHITNIISLQNPAPTIICELDVEIP